jgi:acyl-coenzyme A synthetase/AMP-(fatty) acid ligase
MRKLPAFKLSRRYALAAELPRTATGKIQRHKLRAELQRRRDVSRTAREPVANAPQAVSGDLKPRQDK